MGKYLTVAIILLSLINLSMYAPSQWDLLEDVDYLLQEHSYDGEPALSAAESNKNHWESYDKWSCFYTVNIELLCSEYTSDQNIKVPSILLTKDSHRYEFETSIVSAYNCEQELGAWEALLKGQFTICIFAAELPVKELNEDKSSLWIINTIKTGKGYWRDL